MQQWHSSMNYARAVALRCSYREVNVEGGTPCRAALALLSSSACSIAKSARAPVTIALFSEARRSKYGMTCGHRRAALHRQGLLSGQGRRESHQKQHDVPSKRLFRLFGSLLQWFGLRVAASDVQLWECPIFQ
jgi:hypothetical protein